MPNDVLPAGAGDLTLSSADLADQGGAEGIDAGRLARAAAAAAANQQHDDIGATLQPNPDTEPLVTVLPEGQTQQTQQQQTTEETVTEEVVSLEEIEGALNEAGIDLGIAGADVPKELLPQYQKLVAAAVDLAQDALTKQLEASQVMQSYQEFSERLKNAPDKVLLALAFSQPEVWKKVSEIMTEVEQDPRAKASWERELSAEARLMEAQRRERAMSERYQREKANQVIAATRRAARAHGVSFDTAEKVVALAVKANGGDLELTDVEGLVSELKGIPRQQAKTQQKVVTPQKQAAVRQAPQQQVGAGSAATAQVQRQSDASPGLKDGTSVREGGGGKFRDLIKSINARIVER